MATSSGGSLPTENPPPKRDAEEGAGIRGDSTDGTRTSGRGLPNAKDTGIPSTSNGESMFAVVEEDDDGHGGSGSAEQRAGTLSGGTGIIFSPNNAVVPLAPGSTAALVAEEEEEDIDRISDGEGGRIDTSSTSKGESSDSNTNTKEDNEGIAAENADGTASRRRTVRRGSESERDSAQSGPSPECYVETVDQGHFSSNSVPLRVKGDRMITDWKGQAPVHGSGEETDHLARTVSTEEGERFDASIGNSGAESDDGSQIIDQDMTNETMSTLYAMAQIAITWSKEELDRRDPSALLLDMSRDAFKVIQTLASGHPAFLEGFNLAKECNQRKREELEEQRQQELHQMMGDSGKDDDDDGDDGGDGYDDDNDDGNDGEDGHDESDESEMYQPTRLVFKTPSTALGSRGSQTPTPIESDGHQRALGALMTQTTLKARAFHAKEEAYREELAAVRSEMSDMKEQYEDERSGLETRIREEIEGIWRKRDEEQEATITDLREKIADLAAANDSDGGPSSGIAGATGLDVECDPKYLALEKKLKGETRRANRLKTQLRKERKKVGELEFLDHEKNKSMNEGDQASASSSDGDVSNAEDDDEAEEQSEHTELGRGEGEGGRGNSANRACTENSDEAANGAMDPNTMLVVLKRWKSQTQKEIQANLLLGEDASPSQKTTLKNANECISTLNTLHSTIESSNLGSEWGVLKYSPLEEAKALREIKKMDSKDGGAIEIVPGMLGQLGVLKIPLLKAYTHRLESAVAESTTTAINRASRFLQLFDPHLKVIEAGEIVKAKEIADRQVEHKRLQADNFGVRASLLCIVEHGDKDSAKGGLSSNDGEEDDESEDSDQLQIAKTIYDEACKLAEAAGATSLCLGDSVNNVIKNSSALVAVLSAMAFTTLGDLDLEKQKKVDIDAFRKFDDKYTLSNVCDDCISVLSSSVAGSMTQDKRKALCCMLALFTTVGKMSTKVSANKIFRKAMTVVARKPAGQVTSLEEVRALGDDEDIFRSTSRAKTLTNMVRTTATLLLAPHLPALLRQQYGDPIASLDVFSLCMRVSKSAMEDVSKIFWSSGIFKENTMEDPKKANLIKYFLNGLTALVTHSRAAGRTDSFDEMCLVATSFTSFLQNLKEFVVVFDK